MRLAFVDLVFSWPPLGGAPADLFYTIDGLQRLGHDVHLFYVTDPERDDHGSLDHSEFPFDATRLDYTEDEYTPARVPREIRAAVDKWAPDVVFVCFGFFIKPFVAEALADYPTISRYYAYEPACPRDIRIYKNAATCPKNYLDTPDECRRCTLSFLSAEIRRFHPLGYAREYLETKAYSTAYYRSMLDSIKSFDAIIVYNEIAKVHFAGHHDNVKVIGGGVRLEDFAFSPVPERAAGEKKIILMTGRTEDPSKGMKVMRAAGEELWKSRDDFEMWFTQSGDEYREPWVKNIGWHDHTGIV
ncbi:MAG: hypothetical protein QGG73_12100, partial [Candidatus Hydrogenedentes bacterium]|nr:hypothetical protein [Candidatus Hydrogenedentota bacterium]